MSANVLLIDQDVGRCVYVKRRGDEGRLFVAWNQPELGGRDVRSLRSQMPSR